MIPDFAGRTWLLVLLACVPAGVRWLSARPLMRHPDDPLLAERMLAMGRRSSGAAVMASVALLAIGGLTIAWTLPLLLALRLLAGYPIRRVLLGETWSLARYLSFFLRLIVAMYGFWLAAIALPIVAPLAGRWDWLVAAPLAIVLAWWNVRHAEVVRRVLRSRPIADSEVVLRFQALCAVANITSPRFEQVTVGGGVVANAVAVPSRHKPAVLFTDTLFSELSVSEVDAICAHELAHLEYFSARRVRRMQMVTTILIVAGAALVPAARALGATSLLWPLVAWYLAVLAVLVSRGRHQQRNETASDVRAVALCGDPEALVRGLTRLYTLGRVPRRLDANVERFATHPSLARRIRDIRRAASVEAARLEEHVRFAAPDGATVVTFEPSRVQWTEGEAAVHSFSYTHLAEARVSVKPAGTPSLLVVERGGRRWTMALQSDDVGRAQAVLDLVDGQLGEAPRLPRAWPRVIRAMALMAGAVALLVGQLAAALLAIVAAVRPRSPLLAAAGVGALTAAALTLRDSGLASQSSLAAFVLAAAAVMLIASARASDTDQEHHERSLPLALLGAATVLAVLTLGLRGLDAISLHESARAIGAATILPLALAAALFRSRMGATRGSARAHRAASLAALVPAVLASVAASPWFLDRFGKDPFLLRAAPAVVHRLNGPVISQVRLAFSPSAVQLSPGGLALAVTEENDEDDERGPTVHLGTIRSDLVPVDADDLAFIDDEHVLLLVRGRDDLEIREVSVASPGVVTWRQRVPPIAGARLSVSPSDRSWRLIGWNRAREVVRVQGHVRSADATETHWRRPSAESAYINAVAAAGDRAVLVESHYDFAGGRRATLSSWLALPFSIPRPESRVWTLGPNGAADVRTSRFGAQCVPHPSGHDRLICSIFDGTTTRVLAIEPTGDLAPVASFDGRFFCRGPAGTDWITGWWESSPVALRLSTGESIRIAGQPGEWIAEVGPGDSIAATVGYDGEGWLVRLIAIAD